MDTSYVTYVHNHMYNADYIAPDDLFNGNKFPRHKLKFIQMWGCPVYVLDPTLQQGHKLPKRQPRSCLRIFVEFVPIVQVMFL